MSSSGPSTCRRSARSRNVSESSESSSWLSSDGRGNVGQPARQIRCPADSGSHSDNNSPERVKRKKRRKNLYDFNAEERKKVMKMRVAQLIKLNRLEDDLLRLKLKDNRIPLVLLKRLEQEFVSQPKSANETYGQTKLEDESLYQKKLVDTPQAQVQVIKELPQEKHVKIVDEPPTEAIVADKPNIQKRPNSRLPSRQKLAKQNFQLKLAKESLRPKLLKEFSQSKLAEVPQVKLSRATPEPKLPMQPPPPKLAKETPPKVAKEIPPKVTKEIPPNIKEISAKLEKEIPRSRLMKETSQPMHADETPQPKLANEPSSLQLPKEPPQPKLVKNSSQPKHARDISQPKLLKEPLQPKLIKEKNAEEKSEKKNGKIQQQSTQMTNVILPRKIDPSILLRKVVVTINKRSTDLLVAKKISLQRRLLKELSAERERVASTAEPTPVNSDYSDKCAARLTEKSDDCLTDINKCTKNPIVSNGKKQLRIPIDKSNNDRLPEKLLQDNSRCMLNSLLLSEASAAENQPESSKSSVHSNRKNKRKTVDQINPKVSVNLVEMCIKDTELKGDKKDSDNSNQDVKINSKNSDKDTEKISKKIIVKSDTTKLDISGDSEEKNQIVSAKEIRERRPEVSRTSKVLKNPTEIRTRPRRNLVNKSDNSVDGSSDTNEHLSKELDKVTQHDLMCQAKGDKIVKKNEAEKCDIQSTLEKTLDSTEMSLEKCIKNSESDENLQNSKDETEFNKVLEKSNNEKKIDSEGMVENHVVEKFVKCGDKLPEKLNKNVSKRIKNQIEKSIKSTRNIHNKIEKQADNAQENNSSSQSVVKENNEDHSTHLEIVTKKYNNHVKEPTESTETNLEKPVTLIEETSENPSKNLIGKVKRISRKSINDKTESLSNSISESVRGVCETTSQISVQSKNENLPKNLDEKVKKTIKVVTKQVKYPKTNDTLCNEKVSKDAEKTEDFVKDSVIKHNKKLDDAKEENQISLNNADVNQRPKRNIIKRNLEIYANTCTASKTENDIDKHNESLLDNLNKNDTVEVGKRKSRRLCNKEEHLENIEQVKLENEKLPIEKSEKVPEMSHVNTTDLKSETMIGKRSQRILTLDKNVKSTENLISSNVDNKESCMNQDGEQLTESSKETEVQNNVIAIPMLPQILDKTNVNLIENVTESVHNFIQENVSKDLNEASSEIVAAVPNRRSRRRKSLPDANEKIIRNIVKSASIPDDLQNHIEQPAMNNVDDLQADNKKPELSSVKMVKKYTRLQVTIEKRITRNSVSEDKSVQIASEIEADLGNKKLNSSSAITNESISNENLHKIDSVVDHQEKSVENSEPTVTKSASKDVDKSDHLANETQKIVNESIKSEMVNQKRVTRKTLLNPQETCIDNSSVNSTVTDVSTDQSKKRMRKTVPDNDIEKTEILEKINSVPADEEKPTKNSEETVQNNLEVNSYLENSKKIIAETTQTDVEMNDQHAEDTKKAIKEITKNEITNQKRVTRKTLNDNREKEVQNPTFATSEEIEGSTDESQKRVTRKTILDKTKSTEVLHKDEPILDHQDKSIENTEQIAADVQNNVEINVYPEDSKTTIVENIKSLIVNKKRITRKISPNKRERDVQNSTSTSSEDIKGSTDMCKRRATQKSIPNKTKSMEALHKIETSLDHREEPFESSSDECKKRVTRKSISDKTKSTDIALHKDEAILDHQEKVIESTEEVTTEDIQKIVEINGHIEDSQKAIIENVKSQIENQKRVTRKTSPNKQEKNIQNSTFAISKEIEDFTDESKRRVKRKSVLAKSKSIETLHKYETGLHHSEKPFASSEEAVTEVLQNDVTVNGNIECSPKTIIEKTKIQIANQKRVTKKPSPIEGSSDESKKRVTRKSVLDKSKNMETLHKDELSLDHQEKSIENAEQIIADGVQSNVEINGYTEGSQKAIAENIKSPITNQKRVTRKSLLNKNEKHLENSIQSSVMSDDVEASVDECKNKSIPLKRTSRKARLEKHTESVSSSDDKIVEEPQKINKECSKSEKVARKVSPDKYDKQTESLMVSTLDAVISSIGEEDKILSETLDNKENTKTQIEVNARVTRNSSLKKDRHNKNLIENNLDCVHNEDNKDKSLENVVPSVKAFSKNLTDNKKFRKTSVDKVNEIQAENLVDNNSVSLQNSIEENEQKQCEGSIKRRSKEFIESAKRKSTQNDSEVNSVNVHSLDEQHFSVVDENKKSTIVIENSRRVTRKSAEIHSEAIAKDSAKLIDHNLLPAASESNLAVCDESDKDSTKIIQSNVSESLAEAKGLVNSIKSFNEHNDTCTEILQVSIDVNSESQPNNDKQICSGSLIEKIIVDTKPIVADKIATDLVEISEKTLECSLEKNSLDQQTILANKSDLVSEDLTRNSKRVSLRAFRKVKEIKPAQISNNSSIPTIQPTLEQPENRAVNLNGNVIHAIIESNRDNKEVVTQISADNIVSSNSTTKENIESDIEKADSSFNICSPNLYNKEKLTLNLTQNSNEHISESILENARAIITENVVDKLDEAGEKPQETIKTKDQDIKLIENAEEDAEDSSSNQECNETTSENSFKSALDVMDMNEAETLAGTSNPIDEQCINDLNNLEIPPLDSMCSVEAFSTDTAEEPLEKVLHSLEVPSSESLNNLEMPTFETPSLDSAIEKALEGIVSNSETCSKILENAEKTPQIDENMAKKRRLATLLELKRKCTENLDKKQAADYQNQIKCAIDALIASGSLDSICPSSDSCLGNVTENDENFESFSDDFDNDENLANRLTNLNNLHIPPLDVDEVDTPVSGEGNEKEKSAPKPRLSFLEMNALMCMYCDRCFTSNRELKRHVKVQHRQRLVIKITKTDSNEHKTQLVEPTTENTTTEEVAPLIADVESIPLDERFPMVAEEEPITDGEIKIIVKKESGTKNSHVVKEIKITPKSSDGGSNRVPDFSPAVSDASAGDSSVNSPGLDPSGLPAVRKTRGRPRKYPIFTENEILAKQLAAQVLLQEQERAKRQLELDPAPVFKPVESIIPPYEDRIASKSQTISDLPKERVKRKRKMRVFDNEDTEEDDQPEPVRVKKRRGRPPRKKPEQLLQELTAKLEQSQKTQENAQQAQQSQQAEPSVKPQQAQEPPKSQLPQELAKQQLCTLQEPPKLVPQEPPKLLVSQGPPALHVPQQPPNPRLQQAMPNMLTRPVPALVPSSMPIRITSSLPLPMLTPTLRSATIHQLKQMPVRPPLKQAPLPLLVPSLPPLSMPLLAPLSPSPSPSPSPAPAPSPLAPGEGDNTPNTDEKRRKLVESLQEFIVIGPEEKKRRLEEEALGQEESQDGVVAASESTDATDVSKPEKGLLTRKFGMTKELVVRLTKIDTVPKDCEEFNGDVDDSERIDGEAKASADETHCSKLNPTLPCETEVESSREPLSSVVRMNLRRKLENNNNHVNDAEKCLATTNRPESTQPIDDQAFEAATSDTAKKQTDTVIQQEVTNNQLVLTPRRPTTDKAEADEGRKAKLMMLMSAPTPTDGTNKATGNGVSEVPRAQPQGQQPQIQMQLQHQPQNQLQVPQKSQPLPLPQLQQQAHPQPRQLQQLVQTQSQTVLQLQQPQQFCILFIPDYDGNGPRDVAPTATIVNFQPVPDNEIHNKPLIYMPTTPTKISVDDHAKAYVCANCTKVLDLIGRLEASVGMTEEDKSAITCPYCSNHFQSLFYLEYHVMHEHLKCENEKQCRHSRVNSLRIPTHEVATEFENYITFALKCRSCYDIFGSVLALNDHVMYKHKTLVRLKPAAPAIAGPKAYPVPFVGKNGAIGAVLQCPSDCVCRIGIRSTDTPLQRQQMLKRCPNAMRRLEKIEPAAYEVYTCTLCKSTFLMKDEVVDHLMKMHEVSCKFPCYTCLTSFRSLQIQENHRCSETTLQDFDKLLNIAILPTNVGGKEHNNKFLEREDSSTDEYGAMKTTSPRAPPTSNAVAPVKNGMKRKNGATIAALSQLLNKKPKLVNNMVQPVLPSKRKRKRACPKCKKRFAYRKSLHDHVIYEHIMKGESADGPKKTAVELLMLLSNNRANYKRIEELAEMLNGYTDEDGVSLRKLAMIEDNELDNEEDSPTQSADQEPFTGTDVAQCIRCKIRFRFSKAGNPGQSSSQTEEQRKPLLCDNCEGPKTRRRGPVNNGQHSDDDSSDSQSTSTPKMLMFSCKRCPETFPTVIELKSHKRTVHVKHGIEHLYFCDICSKSFAAPRMLEKHKKIHRESVLGESAKPEEDEASRTNSQNSSENSKDSEANDSLNDKVNSSIRRDSSDSSGTGSKEPEEQMLDCSFCEEVCSSKVSLKNHLKREHGRRASICQFCNGLLIDTSEVRHMLDYHIVPSKTSKRQTTVRNNGNITHCGDSCMQEDVDELIRTLGKHRLQSLMMYHDFEGKCNNAIMRCPICPELFATRESCRFHYVWIHDDNCLLCDETFRSGSSACQHKVDAHTSTASYLWCIQRLVTAIVNTLNLDPDQPSHVLYQVLAMRLDDEEEEARIASESTAGDTAEKGTNEEAPSATERFLEEVLSEDQLPDSGNMIEVVIGREDSEDDLLSMLNLSPNYETCEQIPNASAAPPEEEEEEEEVPPVPASSSVIVSVPTTPTMAASTSLATTVTSPITASPTATVTTASPVLGNYCASGVYLCKHSDGDEQFVLVVAGEDETTYKNDIGSLAVRISETCEVFTLDEITEMLRVHFANLNQNSDGSA